MQKHVTGPDMRIRTTYKFTREELFEALRDFLAVKGETVPRGSFFINTQELSRSDPYDPHVLILGVDSIGEASSS